MPRTEFKINRGITDSHARQLILDENYLKFESGNLINREFIEFDKSQIAAYSFGINWMQYYFVFGREYVIKIKSKSNKIITINFKTYFGRRKKEYHEKCNAILAELYDKYFSKIEHNFIEKFDRNEEFQIGEVVFAPEGLILKTNASIKIKKALIPWDKIRTKNFSTYFAIYAVDDAVNTNRGYSYQKDWNTAVLKNVIETILERKNIELN